VEKELFLNHITFMEKRLFGLTTLDVRRLAFDLAEKTNAVHPFNKETGLAGKDWLRGFFKIYQDLAQREPEPTNLSRMVGCFFICTGNF
jgi:hypothetical protein